MGKINKPGIPHVLDESNGKMTLLLEDGVESYDIQGFASVGVNTLAKQGDTQLTGDVTLSAGSGIALVEAGQNIEINFSSDGARAGDTLFADGNGNASFNVPALKVITFPFSHSDGSILVGETVHQLAVGESLLPQSGISIGTAFDGTTPTLDLLYGGKLVRADGTKVDGPVSIFIADPTLFNGFASIADKFLGALTATDGATPIKIQLSDGVGGDPGSSQGAGTVILYILSAVQV